MENKDLDQLKKFLSEIKLIACLDLLHQNGIDSLEVAKELSDSDLVEMGINKFQAKVLFKKVQEWKPIEQPTEQPKEEQIETCNAKDFENEEESDSRSGSGDDDNKEVNYRLYEKITALVIGINDYKNLRTLKGAVNDANAVDALFKEFGIKEIVKVLNREATKTGIDEAFGEIKTRLWSKDVKENKKNSESLLLIYFAGHGFEDTTGQQPTYYL